MESGQTYTGPRGPARTMPRWEGTWEEKDDLPTATFTRRRHGLGVLWGHPLPDITASPMHHPPDTSLWSPCACPHIPRCRGKFPASAESFSPWDSIKQGQFISQALLCCLLPLAHLPAPGPSKTLSRPLFQESALISPGSAEQTLASEVGGCPEHRHAQSHAPVP